MRGVGNVRRPLLEEFLDDVPLTGVVESLAEERHVERRSSLHVIQYELGPRHHVRVLLHDRQLHYHTRALPIQYVP